MPRIKKNVVNYPHKLSAGNHRPIDFNIKRMGDLVVGQKVKHLRRPLLGIGYVAFFNIKYPIVYFPNSDYIGIYGNQLLETERKSLRCLD